MLTRSLNPTEALPWLRKNVFYFLIETAKIRIDIMITVMFG